MDVGSVNTSSRPSTGTKVARSVASGFALLLGAFALLGSLTRNDGCESYSGCVPDDEATAILWVAIGVALVLFVSAGIGIASCLRVPRHRFQLAAGLALGVIGGVGWVVWLMMFFAAGIRATT